MATTFPVFQAFDETILNDKLKDEPHCCTICVEIHVVNRNNHCKHEFMSSIASSKSSLIQEDVHLVKHGLL